MKYYEREVVKFINSKVLQMWQAPNIFRNKRSITLIEIWIFFNRLCCYFSISLLNGLCILFVFKNWKRVLYSILNFIFEVQNTYVLLFFVIIDIERGGSMTQLLSHTFAHLTGSSFRLKAKLLPIKKILGVKYN